MNDAVPSRDAIRGNSKTLRARRCHLCAALTALALWLGACDEALAESQRVRPHGLRKGDTIMLVSCARNVELKVVQRIQRRLEAAGYRVVVPDHIERQRGYLSGTDQHRAAELMSAFCDPAIDAIFPVTGGFGTTRLLDRLDYDAIQANPKIIIGFSDITGLHLAIAAKTNLVTFHAPNADGAWGRLEGMDAYAQDSFWRCVSADQNRDAQGFEYQLPPNHPPIKTLQPGVARAELVGGNLSLIAALMGTPYEIETSGRVLFIEDVHEPVYRIDRYLSQLKLGGKLSKPAAVIIGQFTDVLDHSETAPWTLEQVFDDYFHDVSYPVISGFPAGHLDANATLPLGVVVEVDADRGRVRVLEPAVHVH